MRIGIIALAVIFFASGLKYLQESRGSGREKDGGEDSKYDRRKFGFSMLMFLVGALVTVYYIVTL